jgi:hypothetical protein
MTGFLSTLVPALIAFAIGLLIAYLIWGGDRSSEA